MKTLHIITFSLLVIGGLNWLLTAFNWNLVHMIFGSIPTLEMIIYILVGLSAIYEAAIHKSICKMCAVEKSAMPMAAK